MIPYAILAGKLIDKFTGAEAMDIRILDLAPDHFSFRVPLSFDIKKVGDIVLFFFEYEKQEYHQVTITDYDMEMIEKNRFCTVYRVDVKEAEKSYGQAVTVLSREYLSYMEKKLYATDVELSSSMTSYPAAEENLFAMEQRNQIREWMKSKGNRGEKKKIKNISWSILIDNPVKISDYSAVSIQEYAKLYWENYSVDDYPYEIIEGIHIGNNFCMNLLPEKNQLWKLIEKAEQEKLHVTFILPAVSQSQFKQIIRYLKNLHRLLESNDLYLTVEVNDYGLMHVLDNPAWKRFILSKGIFLHKHTKDSREHYRKKNGKAVELMNYDFSDKALYLPLYQTNTGTFCPVYGMIYKGNRDNMQRVNECQKECLIRNYRYPEHLKVIGRYNSIFGINIQLFNEKERIEEICREHKLNWMVINL